MITVRHTEMADLDSVLRIYAHARAQMKLSGNPSQWGDAYPPEAVVLSDIQSGHSYVLESGGAVCGVFAFFIGDDPTYGRIEGRWKNDAPYGVIHRVASGGTARGVFPACLQYCASRISNLRIDTHADNAVMRHQLEKHGFEPCGVIYVENGSPRLAYQRTC